jgi:hypothetical protein
MRRNIFIWAFSALVAFSLVVNPPAAFAFTFTAINVLGAVVY